MNGRIILLGPQRQITIGPAARRLSPEGPVVTITAGWQERESEDEELNEHLDGRAVNLQLHRRTQEIVQQDPEFGELRKEFQRELEDLRLLYDLRLAYAMDAWIDLMARNGGKYAARERREAAQAVRRLDAGHLRKVAAARQQFAEQTNLARRPGLVQQAQEVEAILSKASLVVIAGGHVGVLLERMRLFEVDKALGNKPILAWSAGAMALSPLVVLFHDRPPQGPGHAEMYDRGLGVFSGLVPLPHGSRRLMYKDRLRVRRFVKRFGSGAACIMLDPGSEAEWDGRHWRVRNALQLTSRGSAVEAGTW